MKEKVKSLNLKGKFNKGVGRRKEATATVRLYQGKGNIFVNGQKIDEYFGGEKYDHIISAPLKTIGKTSKFDISALVYGGGKRGQSEAIRLGIARALLEYNGEYKATLRRNGFLTRDPRVKERKKYGLKRARKAPQFSKR